MLAQLLELIHVATDDEGLLARVLGQDLVYRPVLCDAASISRANFAECPCGSARKTTECPSRFSAFSE